MTTCGKGSVQSDMEARGREKSDWEQQQFQGSLSRGAEGWREVK